MQQPFITQLLDRSPLREISESFNKRPLDNRIGLGKLVMHDIPKFRETPMDWQRRKKIFPEATFEVFLENKWVDFLSHGFNKFVLVTGLDDDLPEEVVEGVEFRGEAKHDTQAIPERFLICVRAAKQAPELVFELCD